LFAYSIVPFPFQIANLAILTNPSKRTKMKITQFQLFIKANASNIPERSENFAQQLRLTNYGNQEFYLYISSNLFIKLLSRKSVAIITPSGSTKKLEGRDSMEYDFATSLTNGVNGLLLSSFR